MAAATFLLRRSSACVTSASHFYSSYLSTGAKRSHLVVPTVISSVRRFSSPPVVNNIQTPSLDVDNINQQSLNNHDQIAVKSILSQLETLRVELESLRKANEISKEEESPKEEEVVVVKEKEKHPLLKEIEATMSKADFCSPGDHIIPDGFELECDKPGVAKVTLKKAYKKETITIEVFTPSYADYSYDEEDFQMKVIVKVNFSRFFSSTRAEFHCTVEDGGLLIKKIKDPRDGPDCEGVIFEMLPESLQKQLYEYLEIRGISAADTPMLYSCIVNKMKRENNRGLAKFKKLVEDA